MFLVSKKMLDGIAKRSEQLSRTAAVRAAQRLPGFGASQRAPDTQLRSDRPDRSAAPSSAAEGPSGGTFSESAW